LRDEELIEAALFVAGEPVSEKKLKKIIGSLVKTQRAIEHLIYEYRERETALEIIELDKKYVMQLKPEYSKAVEKIAPREISAPALRTLAIIAYHQPITQRELVKIRGNTIYDHIPELKEKNLIKTEPQGRTQIITTGTNFPQYFNLTTNDPQKIREKMIELTKTDQNNQANHPHRKKPQILTTPMYESLLKHCWTEKTLTITTPVTPQTEMATKIARELRLPISTHGKKIAPDHNNTKNAEIIIPTHQKGIDIIERINTRYKNITNQIKKIEKENMAKKRSEK